MSQETIYIPKKHIKPHILIGVVVAVVIGGILFFQGIKKPLLSKNPFIPAPTATPTPDPLAPKNFLLLGYGGGKHEGGALTDTMIVARVAPKEHSIVLVSIPRDLWVELPLLSNNETKPLKINAAFAYGNTATEYTDRPPEYKGSLGGIHLSEYAVSQVIGEPVSYAAAVSFEGFTKSIDILGGIDIDVPYTFEDTFYPLTDKETDVCGKSEEDVKKTIATLSGFILEKEFPCRYETIQYEKGLNHMDGETALKFVRSRHSQINGGDFGRSLRQQAFLRALKTKFLHATIPQILSFIKSVFSWIQTDITITDISDILTLYNNPTAYTIRSINLTEDNVLAASNSAAGQYILVPKTSWEDVQTYLASEFESTGSAGMR